MLRILGFVLAFYVVGFTLIDTVAFDGRFRTVVWQEANYRAYRVSMEVRHLLDKVGIWAQSTDFAVPSRADDRR
jgi:hypothetical protein